MISLSAFSLWKKRVRPRKITLASRLSIIEILCAVGPRKFSDASGVTFGKVPKWEPCSSIVRMTSRRRSASRSNRPTNAVTLSLAIVNCSCSQSASASSRATLKITFEHSSSLRVAPKSWSISSGSQANQSSRTVRERWAPRLARKSPTTPLRGRIIPQPSGPSVPCQPMGQPLYCRSNLAHFGRRLYFLPGVPRPGQGMEHARKM